MTAHTTTRKKKLILCILNLGVGVFSDGLGEDIALLLGRLGAESFTMAVGVGSGMKTTQTCSVSSPGLG
jgi:hypothetical protein